MDWAVQKATELGASRIVPVLAQHGVVKLSRGDGDAKVERWARIARSAAKQCGTPWLPEISPVVNLLDFLADLSCVDVLLHCSLEPDARPFKTAVADLKREGAKRVGVLVGPEGDLTGEEAEAARRAGAWPITLGRLVLRAETAALYALSVLSHEYENWG